jgi:hypothetical protein
MTDGGSIAATMGNELVAFCKGVYLLLSDVDALVPACVAKRQELQP